MERPRLRHFSIAVAQMQTSRENLLCALKQVLANEGTPPAEWVAHCMQAVPLNPSIAILLQDIWHGMTLSLSWRRQYDDDHA